MRRPARRTLKKQVWLVGASIFIGLMFGIASVMYAPSQVPERDAHAFMWAHPQTLADHFLRHGTELGALTPRQYTQAASEFLWWAVEQGIPSRMDDDGSIMIYDPVAQRVGAYTPNGETRTFYKADSPPAWWSADGRVDSSPLD